MYCVASRLAEIEKEIVGMQLIGLYPDWANRIIYFHFHSIEKGTKIVAIRNNYYAGLWMLQTASESAGKER